MPTPSVIVLDEHLVPEAMESVRSKLEGTGSETVVDFSLVQRLDSMLLIAMRDLAHMAEDKHNKVTVRGMNVEVYKALKLARLADLFSFSD